MSATTRPRAALAPALSRIRDTEFAYWQRAAEIRTEWLAHGLATGPAERSVVEDSLARIYSRLSRRRPRFAWVDSPHQALPRLAGLPTHDVLQRWIRPRRPPGNPPFASDLATGLSRLRTALDECVDYPDTGRTQRGPARADPDRPGRNGPPPWPVLPPEQALDAGVPLRVLLRQGVHDALRTSLADGFFLPVRAVLAEHGPVPVAWYGQQDASWIAHHDVLRRLGLARYRPDDADHLDDWAALARSGGWWWPDEQVCVVVERPAIVHVEPLPGGWHGQVRLDRRAGRPAITYRDGWQPHGRR